MFHRNGADSTTMVWDESENAFVFTSTESLHTDATIVHKELQTVKAKNFVVGASVQETKVDAESTREAKFRNQEKVPHKRGSQCGPAFESKLKTSSYKSHMPGHAKS